MLTDRIIGVLTLLLAAVYLYATAQIPTLEIGDPLGPKAFPRLAGHRADPRRHPAVFRDAESGRCEPPAKRRRAKVCATCG